MTHLPRRVFSNRKCNVFLLLLLLHLCRACVTSDFFFFNFLSRFAKKKNRQLTVASSVKMLILKSTDANQVYIGKKEEKKNRSGRWTIIHCVVRRMNNVRVSETKTLILMKPRAVVSRFRITKWPAGGMLYRTCDYRLPSVLFFFFHSFLLYRSLFILSASQCTWLARPYAHGTGVAEGQ